MAIFGSESKVKKETTTIVTDIDETVAASDKSSVVSRSTVNYLDEGAIEKSFDFARGAYEQSGENFAKVLGLAASAMEKGDISDEIAEAYQTANQKETPINKQTLIMVMAGIMGLTVIIAIRRKRK